MSFESMHDAETNKGSGSPWAEDSDNTPRSEVAPPALVETHPTPSHFAGNSEDGYFALRPTESHASVKTSSIQASPTPSIASSSSSSLRLKDAVLDVSRRFSAHLEGSPRPQTQRDLSHASTNSESTVKALSPGSAVLGDSRGPSFPNQAYSALQNQTHPPPHLPPPLRTKSLHPEHAASGTSFSAAIAKLHQSGSRTAGNSPGVTPGLFNPDHSNDPLETPSDNGYYPSPYLHWSHRQAPKETHVADVDVDPISGRKIINEYEIIDELGRGTHGKVKLGRNLTTHEYVAIKIVERYSKKRRLGRLGNAEDKVKREVAILKKARHPNIVALLEVIDDPARKKVYIVLERVEMGEVSWRVKVQKEREIPIIECRRYEREARGNFDDPEAEQEDEAVLALGRLRRAKDNRRRWRRARTSQRNAGDEGPDIWSIEFGGDTDDGESDLEHASRTSTHTTEDSVADPTTQIGRIMSRAHTPALTSPELGDSSSTNNTGHVLVEALGPTPDADQDPLTGTMYGSYEEEALISTSVPASMHSGISRSDIRDFGRRLGHENLMERAGHILDADIHPELLHVPCMSLQAARVAFRDTVLGLQYLHYQGIIHRDIKPPNLLQTRDRRTKISDFGVSYLGRPLGAEETGENLSESDAQDFDEAKELAKTVGTPAFYAPELCYTDIREDNPPVGKAIDVWALGITLFCMLFGRVPFVDQEYVVMRRIADEDIYIPHERLRPVDPKPKSRPTSHGRHLPHAYLGTRAHDELSYEGLDDTLLDLLHRLLEKDPRKRITLEEVRRHPWVVSDIGDKAMWLDETDASRQAQGKRIEISKHELDNAVAPLHLMDRIRDGVKRAGSALGSVLGRTSSTRKRAPSITASTATSANSSSSAISTDGRRRSLRGDESIFSALKASRVEGDHPLSQSVTVSPEQSPHDPFFLNTTSLATPRTGIEGDGEIKSHAHDRATSTMSTTGSVRTIRPSDPGLEAAGESHSPSPVFSPTIAQQKSSNANVSGLLSGAGKLLRTVRDRSTVGRSSEQRGRSASRASSDASDGHADASIAISTASAAGVLDPPQALKDLTPPTSSYTSPESSRPQSVVAPHDRIEHLHPSIEQRLSRKSSASSLGVRMLHLREGQENEHRRAQSRSTGNSTEDSYGQAEKILIRRQIAEASSRPSSVTGHSDSSSVTRLNCPPSPDDEIYRTSARQSAVVSSSSMAPSLETSPASPNPSMLPLITPSSSGDRFAVGTTSTTSNPSLPVRTTDSSEPLYASDYPSKSTHKDLMSSDDTVEMVPSRVPDDDPGYIPDRAIESDDDDDYDDSSDDDGGLQMVRRKSMAQGPGRSISVSNAQIARRRDRRQTNSSVFSKTSKSSRSGSSNTMKKVRSHGDSEPEDLRGRPLAPGP